jgi:hypothetical protein
MARLYLDSGDSVTARKIEQEKDTLYVTRRDYGLTAIPSSRVDRIVILDLDEAQVGSRETLQADPKSDAGDNQRIGLTVARKLELLGTVLGAILIVALLI